jgi:hypothetical protein
MMSRQQKFLIAGILLGWVVIGVLVFVVRYG